jgi:TonB family protein
VIAKNEQHTASLVELDVPYWNASLYAPPKPFRLGRPSSLMPLSSKLWPCVLVLVVAFCQVTVTSFANDDSTRDKTSSRSFAQREWAVFRPAIQNARYTDIPRFSATPRCQNTRPPEALATPTPQLPSADANEKLVVSFIVGTDGKVHSALILQGGDDWTDRLVLQTIRYWRYRPATCNGVPAESEAKVEFSHP